MEYSTNTKESTIEHQFGINKFLKSEISAYDAIKIYMIAKTIFIYSFPISDTDQIGVDNMRRDSPDSIATGEGDRSVENRISVFAHIHRIKKSIEARSLRYLFQIYTHNNPRWVPS